VQQFLVGFVVAVVAIVPVVVLLLRKKTSEVRGTKDGHLKELEELGRLTGELAHEIKNPLSTMKINLKLAAEELEDSNLAESGGSSRKFARALRKIAVVQKEADRLEQILDGFLRYVERGQLQLASVDVNSLISDMVDFYSPQARSHSITIRQGLYDKPLVCKVDADMLKQAVLNLFINAQHAIRDGGELIVRTNRREKDAVIEISDTGSGIAPDVLPKIFNAYYSSRPQGTGLGLPTVKKIIDAHNGTMSVTSEQGKGTSFVIRLPLLVTESDEQVSI